jgi:acetyltransferase-like isoleucine patch superfamily enzyme
MDAGLRSAALRLLSRASRPYWSIIVLGRRTRRAHLIAAVKLQAILRGGWVDIDIAPDAAIGRRVRVEVDPGTRNRLVIGARAMLRGDIEIWLRNGSVEIGEQTELRRGVAVNSSGSLIVGREVLLSFGVVVHCAAQVRVEDCAIVGEYSTLTDSRHLRTPPDVHVLHHVKARPTRIGRNAWLGAQTIVASGVDIGDSAFVGGASLVNRDVPPGWLVAGNPAVPVRELAVEEVTVG